MLNLFIKNNKSIMRFDHFEKFMKCGQVFYNVMEKKKVMISSISSVCGSDFVRVNLKGINSNLEYDISNFEFYEIHKKVNRTML
ncbi:hypothetical protein AVV48_gp62 [Acinetobacter phage phiAC-1]|uniref:hypothetical protein n=1 Tax=Acinetobacter phage phiAC-1 TaxID=1229760 RepID=UPI00028AF1CA|nr:hypothetical protein AVV48_gp62 [Acinetobacter phage phiAC-1]AFU62311.1 hypothetical protein phiAC-1_0062 [Acinetobacter phage phiAC-1]